MFSQKNPLKINKGKVKKKDVEIFLSDSHMALTKTVKDENSFIGAWKSCRNVLVTPKTKSNNNIAHLSSNYNNQTCRLKRPSSTHDRTKSIINKYKESQRLIKKLTHNSRDVDSPKLLKILAPNSIGDYIKLNYCDVEVQENEN